MREKKLEKILLTHQEGEMDFSHVIKENERLVNSIVGKYLGLGVTYQELLTVAQEGLYMAYLKFDAKRGCKFSSFAYNYIKNEIVETISTHNSKGIMSNTDVIDARKINKIINQYHQDYDRNPTDEEISKISGGEFSPEKIKRLTASSKYSSLDMDIGEDLTLMDVIASEEEECHDDTLTNKVNELLSKLDEEDKQVVTYYYLEEITNLAEIARKMKSNANHIKTVLNRAIKTLRESDVRSIKEDEKLKNLN